MTSIIFAALFPVVHVSTDAREIRAREDRSAALDRLVTMMMKMMMIIVVVAVVVMMMLVVVVIVVMVAQTSERTEPGKMPWISLSPE